MKIAKTYKGLLRNIYAVKKVPKADNINEMFFKFITLEDDVPFSTDEIVASIGYHILKTDIHKGHKGRFEYIYNDLKRSDCKDILERNDYKFRFIKKRTFYLDEMQRYTFAYQNDIDTILIYLTIDYNYKPEFSISMIEKENL